MLTVQIDQIIVAENRQRKTFDGDAITRLASSIQRNGLLHPIVVRKESDGIYLVAGERRLRALTQNFQLDIPTRYGSQEFPPGLIPVTMLSDLDESGAYEAELEENVARVDLSWQERASAEAALAALRTKQNPGVSAKAIATEILGHDAVGGEITSLVENVQLAKHLHDPDIAKASSKKEAIKILQKKATIAHRAELAKTFDISGSAHTLHLGECVAFMKTLDAESVDIILTDPPYGMDASKFGDNFAATHSYEDSPEYFERLMRDCCAEFTRVTKPDAHAYIFCTFEGFRHIQFELEALHDWKVFPQPLIWNKGPGNAPWIEYGPSRSYECILYAMKGKKKMNVVRGDVINIAKVNQREHGAEKPVDLYCELLERSALPGNTVLDPFAGSGTIFPAATRAKCTAIGCEINPDYYNIALERIAKNES